jgi:hypothetical protein
MENKIKVVVGHRYLLRLPFDTFWEVLVLEISPSGNYIKSKRMAGENAFWWSLKDICVAEELPQEGLNV